MNAPRSLVFIGPERTDARSVKRIAALSAEGWQVTGFTFHRERGQADPVPAWDNIHLGTTYSRRYFQRLWAILCAFGVVFRHRRRIREAAAIYVINPDNAFLALFGRLASRRRVPLVVEIADIQPVMTRSGVTARVLRCFERFVLRRCRLLVTTSPGFVRHYFEPVQQYRGPVFLLENKVYPSAGLIAARQPRTGPARPGRWTIGFFGVLRCQRSMDLICQLAAEFPEKLTFVLRGVPAGLDADLFHQQTGAHSNIEYGGPYRYPDDLASLYGSVDFNWCFDFSAAGTNSTWLLPNRIYEGGLYHCPALAFADTETAAWVTANHCGEAFSEDLHAQLHAFFAALTLEKWQAFHAACASAPDELFTAESDYTRLSAALEKVPERGEAGG